MLPPNAPVQPPSSTRPADTLSDAGKISSIAPPQGRLGVLLPGMGAVSTTFIAGCMLARRGLAAPVGSITQMQTLQLTADPAAPQPRLRDALPLAGLDSLVFGGWDLFPDDALTAARTANVLQPQHLEPIAAELAAVRPMPAVFFPRYVRRLRGEHVKAPAPYTALAEALRADIRAFCDRGQVSRCVAVWCGSTEAHQAPTAVHDSLAAFEAGLRRDDPGISPSMLYAYACLQEGVAFANGAPNLTCEVPALQELAQARGVPLAGKDFKTGQTLMKTMVAPGLRARMLGVRGWFSTNILGNRDGEVLDEPQNFRTKEVSKLGVLESILRPEQHPELYGNIYHKVRIEYYPPRGDEKEGWDNLDIFGWLGYPMQLKVDFLCRDSILAAPIVLDLALLLDLAARAGMGGTQQWLSFFFKSPMQGDGRPVDNDLFVQQAELMRVLRGLHGRCQPPAPR